MVVSLDDEMARIFRLIEDINYDYVEVAYYTRQWEMSTDVDEIDPQKALIGAVTSLAKLHQHTKELSDLLYPRLHNWA